MKKMLKETYFDALKRVHAENPNAIYVIVSQMKANKSDNLYDQWFRSLAPGWKLLKDWNQGKITWEEYTTRFLDQIAKSKTAQEALKEIAEMAKDKDVYLICFCHPRANCHRYLLIDLINSIEITKMG